MSAGLIVNADDYGWTEGVNEAVARLVGAGTVSSTTVMANMPCADQLPELVAAHPRVGVGVHLTLTQGAPLAPVDEVRSLVSPDGELWTPPLLLRRLRRGRIALGEVARELSAQIERVRALLGATPDHWDSHHGVHRHEPLFSVCLRVARRAGLRAMRAHKHHWPAGPLESGAVRALRPGGGLKSAAFETYYRWLRLRGRWHFATPRGLLVLGRYADVARFRADRAGAVYEIACHPAVDTDGLSGTSMLDVRVAEYEQLASDAARAAVAEPGRRLLRFADLGRAR